MKNEGYGMEMVTWPPRPVRFTDLKAKRKMPLLNRFWKRNKETIIRIGLLLAAFLVVSMVTKLQTTKRLTEEFEIKIEEARVEAVRQTTEQLRAEYNVSYREEQKSQMEIEATALAKMLYPMQYNTNSGLKSACWCVFNRVSSRLYPDTVESVCAQASQFMGWSDSNPVIQSLYDLAYEEVQAWHNGVHPMDVSYVYLEWTQQEITLRTTYEGGHGCHYWYESDWSDQQK